MKIDIEKINAIALAAGEGILKVYNDPEADFETTLKTDNSPLTVADGISHHIICKCTKRSTSEHPDHIRRRQGYSVRRAERLGILLVR